MSEKNRREILNQIKRSEDRLFVDWNIAFKKEKQYRNIFMKAVRELPSFVFDIKPQIREVEQVRLDGAPLPMLTLCWGEIDTSNHGDIKAYPLGPYILIDRGCRGTPKRYKCSLYLPHEKVHSSAYRAVSWEGRLTDSKKINRLEEQLLLGLFNNL